MGSDAPELGKGLFGYRRSVVQQIISDRDIMLRQAEGRVRAAESRVAELEGELGSMRERNGRMEEQLERLRTQFDAFARQGAGAGGVAVADPGTAEQGEDATVAWEPEDLGGGTDDLAAGSSADAFAPEETAAFEYGDASAYGAGSELLGEPAQFEYGGAAEPDYGTYGFGDAGTDNPAGYAVDDAASFGAAGGGGLEPALDDYADAGAGAGEFAFGDAGGDVAGGGLDSLLGDDASPGGDFGESADLGIASEPTAASSEEALPFLETWEESSLEIEGATGFDDALAGEDSAYLDGSYDDQPAAAGETTVAGADVAWTGGDAFPVEDADGVDETIQEEQDVSDRMSGAGATDLGGVAAQGEAPHTSEITSRFLTEELAGILTAAEESAARIVERAQASTEQQIAEANRLWREVQGELARFAAWRQEVEPIIQSVRDQVDEVRGKIESVPERIREALAPMADAISSVDNELADLSAAAPPPLLLAPAGLEGADQGDEWGAAGDFDDSSDALEGLDATADGDVAVGLDDTGAAEEPDAGV